MRRRYTRAVALTSALALAGPAAAQFQYNQSTSSASPRLAFWPSRSGTLAQTWNDSDSVLTWATWAPDTLGEGLSIHTTTLVGATASVSWQGTAVWFAGAGTGAYALDVDGTNHGQTLSATGLDLGWHTATLTVASGEFEATGQTTLLETGNTGATLNWEDFNATNSDGTVASWVNVSGCSQCSVATTVGGGGNSTPVSYSRVQTNGSYDTISFVATANASFVYIEGSLNYNHGNYTVSLSPAMSNTYTPANQTFSGLSAWARAAANIFFGVLDPTVRYTITLQNLGATGEYFDFAWVSYGTLSGGTAPATTVTALQAGASTASTPTSLSGTATSGASSATATSSSPSTNLVAAIAGAVGGVVGAVLVAVIAFFWLRRRRNRVVARYYEDRGPFEIDGDGEPKLTPFYTDAVPTQSIPQLISPLGHQSTGTATTPASLNTVSNPFGPMTPTPTTPSVAATFYTDDMLSATGSGLGSGSGAGSATDRNSNRAPLLSESGYSVPSPRSSRLGIAADSSAIADDAYTGIARSTPTGYDSSVDMLSTRPSTLTLSTTFPELDTTSCGPTTSSPPPSELSSAVSPPRPGMLRLATLSPDRTDSASGAPSASTAQVKRRPAVPRPRATSTPRQETDAGRIQAAPAPLDDDVVPPMYDPAWAEEGRPATAAAGDGGASPASGTAV
ncbi:hypothetical protein Q5752_000630 [Cryptotrichosporon argae]